MKRGQLTQQILELNANRDPARVKIKLARLREGPLPFMRGTAPLFYALIGKGDPALASPLGLVCGDLHLENFGTYKGDNRLVYFDINDFDEACRAPIGLDFGRALASWYLFADAAALAKKITETGAARFSDSYFSALADGKPRWIERATARGAVRNLMRSLRQRGRRRLLKRYTAGRARRLHLDVANGRAMSASAGEIALLSAELRKKRSPAAIPGLYAPLDIARRVAGNSSLGFPRFIVLTRGRDSRGEEFLLDVKYAPTSALARQLGKPQPAWKNEAERIVSIQGALQAIPQALTSQETYGGAHFVQRELQPSADRLDWQHIAANRKIMLIALEDLGAVTAWAHLRGAGRWGAALVDELQRYAAKRNVREDHCRSAMALARQTRTQWKTYAREFDRSS
jgi:uncharacterized protein (DUF2252 family)